jgi:hypothetical protein
MHTMKTILLSAMALLLTACSTLSTRTPAPADLARVKKLYVEHRLADDRGLDQMVAAELRRLGYDASSGPLTMMPPGVDAIVSYEDQWNWDFTLYIIELDIGVSDARTGKVLADGRYYHPTPGSKSPEEMVAAVIDPIFKRR